MSDHPSKNDDVFGERVGRVLRAPERFGDQFEDDLVRAIHADRPMLKLVKRPTPLSLRWWRTPSFRLSPLVGLAAAATLFGVAILAVSARPRPAELPSLVAVHDTVNVVRFVFVGQAKSVSLVGDFNGWGSRPLPLETSDGRSQWTALVTLPSGRYEYAFIVDGKRWVADPFAPPASDEFNTNSSVIIVGT